MKTPKEKAKILFDKMLELNDEATSIEMMVEFARLETAQLQADKAELLEALESVKPALRYFPEKLNEIESLIQKYKQ